MKKQKIYYILIILIVVFSIFLIINKIYLSSNSIKEIEVNAVYTDKYVEIKNSKIIKEKKDYYLQFDLLKINDTKLKNIEVTIEIADKEYLMKEVEIGMNTLKILDSDINIDDIKVKYTFVNYAILKSNDSYMMPVK